MFCLFWFVLRPSVWFWSCVWDYNYIGDTIDDLFLAMDRCKRSMLIFLLLVLPSIPLTVKCCWQVCNPCWEWMELSWSELISAARNQQGDMGGGWLSIKIKGCLVEGTSGIQSAPFLVQCIYKATSGVSKETCSEVLSGCG